MPATCCWLISQSGETKDLVDVIGQVRQRGLSDVALLAVVNNENSTIPQEKADFFLPILCGPEIAVAATKSFTAQLALFYLLAAGLVENEAALAQRLEQIRYLLEVTLRSLEEEVSEVALKIFLKPSLHILGTSLIGLAREGALKIREVVLNHAEGYDAAEFKHGPNTILGKNTIYSLRDLENVLADCADFFKEAISGDAGGRPGMEELGRFLEWVRDFRFRDFKTEVIQRPGSAPTWRERWYRMFKERVQIEKYFSHYPLIFLCPPDERDKRITITQIHTHKIRGADIILLAEEDDELRKAVEGRPAGSVDYFCKYIRIPKSGDRRPVHVSGRGGFAAAGPAHVGGQDEVPEPHARRKPRRASRRAQECLQVHHRRLRAAARDRDGKHAALPVRLDTPAKIVYFKRRLVGRLAQLVEHRFYTPGVRGSSPLPPRLCIYGAGS